MKAKSLKSSEPKAHDNTDGDLILVPPSVLENKLEPLERYSRVVGAMGSDIALGVTLFIPIVTNTQFKDFGPISAATIQGAFYVAAFVVVLKLFYNFYDIRLARIKGRADVVRDLLLEEKDKN